MLQVSVAADALSSTLTIDKALVDQDLTYTCNVRWNEVTSPQGKETVSMVTYSKSTSLFD